MVQIAAAQCKKNLPRKAELALQVRGSVDLKKK